MRAVGYQLIGFLECAVIEQELDALAGGHLAFFVLPFATLRPAAFFGQAIAFLKLLQLLFQVHEWEDYRREGMHATGGAAVHGPG